MRSASIRASYEAVIGTCKGVVAFQGRTDQHIALNANLRSAQEEDTYRVMVARRCSCVAALLVLLLAAGTGSSLSAGAMLRPNGSVREGGCITQSLLGHCLVICEDIDQNAGHQAANTLRDMECDNMIVEVTFYDCFAEEPVLKQGWFTLQGEFTVLDITRYDRNLLGIEKGAFEDLQLNDNSSISLTINGKKGPYDYKTRATRKSNEMVHKSKAAAKDSTSTKYYFSIIEVESLDNILSRIRDGISDFQYVSISYDPYLNQLLPSFFEGLNHVEELSITHCGITDIDPNTFADLDSLYELDLSYNLITTLQENAIPSSFFERDYFEVNLMGNKLDCRSDLSWLADRVEQYPYSFYQWTMLTCNVPDNCKGEHITIVYCERSTPAYSTVFEGTVSPPICCGSTSTPDIEPTTIPIEQTTPPRPEPSTTVVPSDALPCEEAEIREVLRAHRSRRSLNFPPTRLFTVASAGGALEIELAAAAGAWTLFWVEHGGAPAPCYKHEGVGAGRVTIEDALPASDYLICLLRGPRFDASPFNCRAHRTPPATERSTTMYSTVSESTSRDTTTNPTESTLTDTTTSPTESTPTDTAISHTQTTLADTTTSPTESTPTDTTTNPTDSTPTDTTTSLTGSTPIDFTSSPTEFASADTTTSLIESTTTSVETTTSSADSTVSVITSIAPILVCWATLIHSIISSTL